MAERHKGSKTIMSEKALVTFLLISDPVCILDVPMG
jgi:hypothetical protein